MRQMILTSLFVLCFSFLNFSTIKAQTYSSSLPVVATPVATPLIVIATPTPIITPTATPIAIIVATPAATNSSVTQTPVSGAADYTYLFLLIGFTACIFAFYRLKYKS